MDTEDTIVNQQKSNQTPNINQFQHIPDEQLMRLASAVCNEMSSRLRYRKINEEFSSYLNDLKALVPDKYLKTFARKLTDPQALNHRILQGHIKPRLEYLMPLLAQDWSGLWGVCDPTKKYCVYAHTDPCGSILPLPIELGEKCRIPFYIGKGTQQRAYDFKRNQGHGIKLRQLLREGNKEKEIVHIFKSNLCEVDAFELEAKLIYFFGTIYEKGRRGVLLNLDLSLRPKFMYDSATLEKRMLDHIKARRAARKLKLQTASY
jgi:hypothetical protein